MPERHATRVLGWRTGGRALEYARSIRRATRGPVAVCEATLQAELITALTWAEVIVARARVVDLHLLQLALTAAADGLRQELVLVDVRVEDLGWLVERVHALPRWPSQWIGPRAADHSDPGKSEERAISPAPPCPT